MKHRILVWLDALLDTRIATVSQLDQQAAVKLLTDDRYESREVDDFEAICGISKAQFQEAYAKRDVETLKVSRITGVPIYLDKLVRQLEKDANRTPHIDDIKIDINIWPYQLDQDEQDLLITMVMHYVGVETLARCVNYAPEEVTPSLLRRDYTVHVIYSFAEWFEKQAEAFQVVKTPALAVVAPALYKEGIPKTEDLTVEGMGVVSPFVLTPVMLSEMIRLDLIPARLFTILRI